MRARSSRWQRLRTRLITATSYWGGKAALAREMGVHRHTVSRWLEEGLMPSAECTLHLLEWVTAFEANLRKAAVAKGARKAGN